MARFAGALWGAFVLCPLQPQARIDGSAGPAIPSKETLSYSVEWRMIDAGNATLKVDPTGSLDGSPWQIKLHLESAGLVSKLYHLSDNYDVRFDNHFCASASLLDAMEKNRHRETKVEFSSVVGK